jgi:hypothetical protein
MSIAKVIIKNRGKKWAKDNCGTTEAKTNNDIALFVYQDFLDSEEGQRSWNQGEQDEEKVDYIFDQIYTRYVSEGEMMTENEWTQISDSLYNMVYEGVF